MVAAGPQSARNPAISASRARRLLAGLSSSPELYTSTTHPITVYIGYRSVRSTTSRDGLDLDEAAFGEGSDGEGGAGRRWLGHELGVDRVHRCEVVHAGEEDGGLDDVVHAGAGRVEHGAEVAQRALGLGF